MNRRNLFKTLLGLGAGVATAKLAEKASLCDWCEEDRKAIEAARAEGPATLYDEQVRNTLGLCQTVNTSGTCSFEPVQWTMHVCTTA